jgi:hypothetical protein
MSTPAEYVAASKAYAESSQISAELATEKRVGTSNDKVSSAQSAADAYDYMLNCRSGVTTVNSQTDVLHAIQTLVNQVSAVYLGALASSPSTAQIGASYFNTSTNQVFVWNGTNWVLPSAVFDGYVNAGTSNAPIGRVQLRHDVSTSWVLNNPVLGLGEIGLEVDTHKLKIGNGSQAWNDLGYLTVNKSEVSGIQNVNNTSDMDKPVSTLQQTAIDIALQTAKDYALALETNHFIDVGPYSVALTNTYPTTGGTGTNETIKRGNVFTILGSGTINTIPVSDGDSLRALVDNPTSNNIDWCITKAATNINTTTIKPYIVVYNIPGKVVNNYLYSSHIFTCTVNFTTNLEHSHAISRSPAFATFTFDLLKNGIVFGTLMFNSASTVGIFSSSLPITFNEGDTFEMQTQLAAEPSLTDISISLYGTRP